MAQAANWNYPTSIRFGAGRIKELAQACAQVGIKNPLLVTDRDLASLPVTTKTLEHLVQDGLGGALFSDVDSNPTGENLDAGVEVYLGGGHDGVIAFGGGSGLDLGKLVAFQAGQERPVWDFEDVDDWWTRARADAIAPIIGVPTTAGTGSEVGRAGVLVKSDVREKKIIFHPKLLPSVVISDPELTVGLPPHLTAATGLDAFIHCFEAFCAPGYHPMADGIGLEGMRLCQVALPVAYADGTDLEARGHMLTAATMGASAFQKGLGGVHAISHAVGAMYNTHHGLTNAIVLPYVLKANEAAISDRMDVLARVLNLSGKGFVGVLDWVLSLRQELGIPNTLKDIGVDDERIDEIASLAHRDPSASTNPIALGIIDYGDVFRRCVNGQL